MQRYSVKFNNGAWKVFDNETYTDVQIELLYKLAVATARKLNRGTDD